MNRICKKCNCKINDDNSKYCSNCGCKIFNKYYEFYIKNDYSPIFVSNKNTIIYGYVDLSLEKEFLNLMSEMGYHEQENCNSTTSLLNII